MTPIRVQQKRVKGFKLPPNTRSVARPSKWGNPFVVGKNTQGRIPNDKAGAVNLFRDMVHDEQFRTWLNYPSPEEIRQELRGWNLACYCDSSPCHADVLLEIANAPEARP